MEDWLGSGDQYVITQESHFPEQRNTVRPGNYQSDEPIRYAPRAVGTFEGKYLAEQQGVPTGICRCDKCRNYYYGPSVARPMRTETVDERDRRMYMNRCRPAEARIEINALPPAPAAQPTTEPITISPNMLLIMFLFVITIFIALAVHSGISITDLFKRGGDEGY